MLTLRTVADWLDECDEGEFEARLLTGIDFREFRNALSGVDGSSGGYAAGEGFLAAFELALDTSSVMRQVADVVRTSIGGDYLTPTLDESFSSKRVRYPEAIERDAPNFLPQLGRVLGERIGRIQNRLFTVGTGAGQPYGIVPAATSVAATSATALAVDDFANMMAALGGGYHSRGEWMMHPSTWAAILKIKDGSGGSQAALWSLLFGPGAERVHLNSHMESTMAAGNRTVLYGDCSRYLIRDIGTLRLHRYLEQFVPDGQFALEAWLESDGNLIDTGATPVVALLH
jgi:predicted phage gp36 major capsid-like protein